MKSQTVWVLLVSLLLVGCGQEPEPPKAVQEQAETVEQDPLAKAISEIEKFGGGVEAIRGGLAVNLSDTQVTDVGLGHLKGLTNFQVLGLGNKR